MIVRRLLYFINKQKESYASDKSNTDNDKKVALRFINYAYNKVISTILSNHDINDKISAYDINELNITQNMKTKLISFLSMPISKDMRKEEKQSILYSQLVNIAGIGHRKALELINLGLTSPKQLLTKKWKSHINADTQLLIKYAPSRAIQYAEIKKLEPILTGFKHAKTVIVGGFRREKPVSKDIDVMVVSNDDILPLYINHLYKHFGKNRVHIYMSGVDKISLVLNVGKTYYKIDIFRTDTKLGHHHAMLLYSTGSKHSNIRMRAKAKKLGMTLNQNGLFKDGKPLPIKSEHDIFRLLDMPYVKPTMR
jgi:DNA polymerase/3'-5' exonuclease PolX